MDKNPIMIRSFPKRQGGVEFEPFHSSPSSNNRLSRPQRLGRVSIRSCLGHGMPHGFFQPAAPPTPAVQKFCDRHYGGSQYLGFKGIWPDIPKSAPHA